MSGMIYCLFELVDGRPYACKLGPGNEAAFYGAEATHGVQGSGVAAGPEDRRPFGQRVRARGGRPPHGTDGPGP